MSSEVAFQGEQMSAGLDRALPSDSDTGRVVDRPCCVRPSAPLWTPCAPGQRVWAQLRFRLCPHHLGARTLPPPFLFCFSFLSCLCYFFLPALIPPPPLLSSPPLPSTSSSIQRAFLQRLLGSELVLGQWDPLARRVVGDPCLRMLTPGRQGENT